jgi:hypothetical protein
MIFSSFRAFMIRDRVLSGASTQTDEALFGILNFGHWDLFEIWCLEFGIYAPPPGLLRETC